MTGKGLKVYNNAPTKEKQRKRENGLEDWEIRSSLLMLDLNDKLYDLGKAVDGNVLHSWEVLGMNDDLWDRVRGLGSVAWEGREWVALLVDQSRLTWLTLTRLSVLYTSGCIKPSVRSEAEVFR